MDMAKNEVSIEDLKPVSRTERLVLQENDLTEVVIWKIYVKEKFYQGESQGDFPTFEVTEPKQGKVLILQSRSSSSYAMLDDWDDRKAPCDVYVWKDVSGSKTEIKWAYKEA
jgi:hypothetical protein